jgi:putative ABC transport system permease protein
MSIFDPDHWHEILQSLRRNRLRTFLTACGVFWGVFMLVVMLGFGRGLEKAVEQDFGLWAYNTVLIWGQQTSKPYAGRQPGRRVQLTLDDLEAVRQVEGVDLVLPRNYLGGWGARSKVSRREKSQSFGVSGETPEYRRLEALLVEHGRFINPTDLQEHRKVAVIGSRVREMFFDPDEDPIGQTIAIGTTSFQVVGVYHTPASGSRGDWFNGRVFVPRTTFARTFGTGDRISSLALLVGDRRPSVEVEAEIRALLKARHRVHPDDPRGFGGFNRDKEFRKIANLFFAIKALSWTVGVLTLLAGAIGVSNIMMIAVAERTREIGIRKAVGATPLSIMGQIVAEATLLTALAGYLGLVAAVGVLEVAARIVDALPVAAQGPRFFASPELDLSKAVAAAAVLTVAGALAGLAPARAAVAVRPTLALAHE